MPDNRAQAERRAHCIKKKFLKNNRLRKQYACQRICKESSTKRYSPVKVETATSTLERPIVKLVLLLQNS
jgi:hypothetical protein